MLYRISSLEMYKILNLNHLSRGGSGDHRS